jgi:hypothetical protein
MAVWPGFVSWQGQDICLFSTESRMADHPVSYTVNSGCSFPGLKRPRHVAEHPPRSSGDFKSDGTVLQLPHFFLV